MDEDYVDFFLKHNPEQIIINILNHKNISYSEFLDKLHADLGIARVTAKRWVKNLIDRKQVKDINFHLRIREMALDCPHVEILSDETMALRILERVLGAETTSNLIGFKREYMPKYLDGTELPRERKIALAITFHDHFPAYRYGDISDEILHNFILKLKDIETEPSKSIINILNLYGQSGISENEAKTKLAEELAITKSTVEMWLTNQTSVSRENILKIYHLLLQNELL